MRILKKKAVKSLQGWGPPNPRLPPVAGSSDPSIVTFAYCCSFRRMRFSIEHILYYFEKTEVIHSKYFGFVFSALSCLFFTSNSALYIGRGVKIFFTPGAWYPSYATDKIIWVGLV